MALPLKKNNYISDYALYVRHNIIYIYICAVDIG